MNRDGKIDMLEKLNPKGQVISREYDLDFDGKKDVTKEVSF